MARIRSYKKVASENMELNKVQENLDEYLVPITNSPIIDGVLLKDISLVSGQVNLVAHKLQREPLGWLIIRRRANASIWDSQDSNVFKSRSLALECSASVVVDLWVF